MRNKPEIEMIGVREYGEGLPVILTHSDGMFDEDSDGCPRLVLKIQSAEGYAEPEIDLLDVLDWIKDTKPELLK